MYLIKNGHSACKESCILTFLKDLYKQFLEFKGLSYIELISLNYSNMSLASDFLLPSNLHHAKKEAQEPPQPWGILQLQEAAHLQENKAQECK